MLSNFSHIYFEKPALEYPSANDILRRFSRAKLIEIKDYRDIFNRKRQDWRLQKKSMKLILAKRKSEFLYPGSPVTPNFNEGNYFYNTLIMNCLYDCQYCYLQGMYPSANIVIFTNLEDYFKETDAMLDEKGSAYISISYDTDLLAFENIAPYSRKWIEYASSRENLKVELRTKSSNYSAIKHLKPVDNFILAWTVSPEEISNKYESGTPSLKQRLQSALAAINDGWKVRICVDPILLVQGWERHYAELVRSIKETLPMHRIHDISLGTFRMNKDYYETMRKMRLDSEILHFPYKINGKTAGYAESEKTAALQYLKQGLSESIPEERIFSL